MEPNLTGGCQNINNYPGGSSNAPDSVTWQITGSWEFSTDGSNPVQLANGQNLQWSGRTAENDEGEYTDGTPDST